MSGNGFTTCLWFDGDAEAAAGTTCPSSRTARSAGPAAIRKRAPGSAGSVMVVEFEINGQKFVGLNGGPQFPFTEAISFQIHCADEAEADYYYDELTKDGGEEAACGWVKDKFGVSWQVIPPRRHRADQRPGPGAGRPGRRRHDEDEEAGRGGAAPGGRRLLGLGGA